jgi:DNA-directed RNA polymerase specialized sigma24 family protein
MTAKEYLGQAYKLDLRINSKLEQVATLRSLTQKVTASYDHHPVSKTRNASSLENTILRLVQAEEELNASVDSLVDLKMEIARTISFLEDMDHQILLEKRYLSFHSWEEIAKDLQCTIRWVHERHKRALKAMQNLLDERGA